LKKISLHFQLDSKIQFSSNQINSTFKAKQNRIFSCKTKKKKKNSLHLKIQIQVALIE